MLAKITFHFRSNAETLANTEQNVETHNNDRRCEDVQNVAKRHAQTHVPGETYARNKQKKEGVSSHILAFCRCNKLLLPIAGENSLLGFLLPFVCCAHSMRFVRAHNVSFESSLSRGFCCCFAWAIVGADPFYCPSMRIIDHPRSAQLTSRRSCSRLSPASNACKNAISIFHTAPECTTIWLSCS